MEKKKVYVVTCGEDEDYGISRIFSTAALALAYLDTVDDAYRIEEWDIDEPVEREDKVFQVRLKLEDKSVFKVYVTVQKQDFVDCFRYGNTYGEFLEFYIKSDSRARAIEEASQRFDQVIANESSKFPLMRQPCISYKFGGSSFPMYDYMTGAIVMHGYDKLKQFPDTVFVKILK